MALTVDIDLRRAFAVAAPFDEVFDVLSDVPASVAHFPKVHRLTELGPGAYSWEMERIGAGPISLQTIYACRYVADRGRGSVAWVPLAGIGNAQVGGSWAIRRRAAGTALAFRVDGVVELPFPALMRAIVAPIVSGEFAALIDRYISNLTRLFGAAAA